MAPPGEDRSAASGSPNRRIPVRAASDVGGTFTDSVYYPVDPETGRPGAVQVAKADTTPPEFEQGVMNAMVKAGLSPAALDFFAHGSTVVINAS
ncbi:hypothetical protein OY671_012867, partial [Metschnikowia pulcherrima]